MAAMLCDVSSIQFLENDNFLQRRSCKREQSLVKSADHDTGGIVPQFNATSRGDCHPQAMRQDPERDCQYSAQCSIDNKA